MKYNNYTDLGIISGKKPANTHLFFETSAGGLYLVDSTDETSLYYSSDKSDNWTQIDCDPGDAHGGANDKERPRKIAYAWHDRSNTIIWFVDCDNDGADDTFNVWTLDYSVSESSPTVTEVDSETSPGNDDIIVHDIFIIGAQTFVLWDDTPAVDPLQYVTDVSASPFVEMDSISAAGARLTMVVVVGTKAYWFLSVDAMNYIKTGQYDDATETISYPFNLQNNYFVISDKQYRSLAYDGSDVIYGVFEATGDGKNYYIGFSITGDSYTIGGEYNIILMSDRNTVSGVKEKAFHETEYKIYQIQENITQLYLIAVPGTDAVIIGITDNFFINNDGDMWEYEDQISLISSTLLDHETGEASQGIITLIKDSIPIVKNMFLQFYHNYTTASATSEDVIFEGLVTNFTEDQMQTVTLVNPAKKEIKTILPSGDYTKDSDGLMSQLLIDYNNYSTEGTLSDGGDLGTISLGGVLSEETIFDGCAKFDGFEWYFNPTGQLFYNNGTVDSGVNYTQANALSGVNVSHVHEEYNKIKVRGAYVDGVQVESAWQEDLSSQQRLGVNERIFLISFLNTIALCNTAASNILTLLAKDPLRVKFTIKDTTNGYIQVGETITFEYASSGKTVASDQFIITSATINKYGDIRYTIVSELS